MTWHDLPVVLVSSQEPKVIEDGVPRAMKIDRTDSWPLALESCPLPLYVCWPLEHATAILQYCREVTASPVMYSLAGSPVGVEHIVY